MFVFKKNQVSYDFGGVTIGGQPGENPTVLIGGLFFKGQPIVENTKQGLFDEELASDWIATGVEMEDRTGHPLVIQAFGRTPEAMEKHISWLADSFEGPFMFESTSAKARKRGIEYCDEIGLSDRAIYNSVNLSMKNDEKALLRESSLNMAVVLGWSPRATNLSDRMDTVREMLEDSRSMGVEKVLVDPATLPVGAGYGLEYRTILAIKSELGLPTCLGPHNAPSAWRFIRQEGLDDDITHLSTVVASTVAAQLFATDCIMYGSMVRTKEVYAAVALIGNALATAVAEASRTLGRDAALFDPPTYT